MVSRKHQRGGNPPKLSGMRSFNNILQEPKLLYDITNTNSIIPPGPADKKESKINLAQIVFHMRKLPAEKRHRMQSFVECANILGLKNSYTLASDSLKWKDYNKSMTHVLMKQIDIPEFLGVMIVREEADKTRDYSAIVMYDDLCAPKRFAAASEKKYRYMDPNNTSQICLTQDEIKAKINELNPIGMLFLYAYDEEADGESLHPYMSVATTKMREIMDEKAAGSKKPIAGICPSNIEALQTIIRQQLFKGALIQMDYEVKEGAQNGIKYPIPGMPAILKNWQPIITSGNNSDCLIHTILTQVSPEFRKLYNDKKNDTATWFRNTELVKLPAVQSNPEAIARITTAGEFLDDDEIRTISNYWCINFLAFKIQNNTINRESCVPFLINTDQPVYIIVNNGSLHFQPLRSPTGEYTLKWEDANNAVKELHLNADNICEFDDGDIVKYKDNRDNGKEHKVSHRRFNEKQECIALVLDDKPDTAAEQGENKDLFDIVRKAPKN